MSRTEVVDVLVPDIGDFDAVPVIEILVAAGARVALDDPLVTLESDKATMDVPAPFAGTVEKLEVEVGDTVSQGTLLLRLSTPAADDAGEGNGQAPQATLGSDASALASQAAPVEAAAPDAITTAIAGDSPEPGETPPRPASESPSPSRQASEAFYASPSVRRIARELGVDLARAPGTGRKGRITKQDVERVAKTPRGAASPAGGDWDLAPWPSIEFEKFGPVERVPRSRIQKIAAPNLARNWVMIPHVTHNDEADITELEAFRKQLNAEYSSDGVKLTMVGFLVAACVATLKQFPDFNSSLDGDELVRKQYYNIGFAADTPGGLVVPVIRDADRHGILDIARELRSLSARAREGKLAVGDMQGGTFTISSLGGIGGTSFTPIINAPEVAILGVTRAAIRPVWSPPDSDFAPRMMLPLSLSYDHRVIDGAAAARFVAHLVTVLCDLRLVLL